jgi:hypothetical protein
MTEPGTRGSPIAGLVLCLTGILVLLGSLFWWATCPTTPCGGILMSLSDYSGIDLGFGKVTALAALALVGIGTASLLRPGRWELSLPAAFAAVVIVASAVASIVWMYVIPGDDKEYSWPPVTATVIAILGFVALVASRFLPGVGPQVSGNNPT